MAQSGIDESIGNAPLAVVNEPGFNFAGQDYRSLRSVDRVSITLTLLDGDSAVGDRDFGKLTLMLEGVNTGILLNGFRDSELDTRTITLGAVFLFVSRNHYAREGDRFHDLGQPPHSQQCRERLVSGWTREGHSDSVDTCLSHSRPRLEVGGGIVAECGVRRSRLQNTSMYSETSRFASPCVRYWP